MALSLDQFIEKERAALASFAADYRRNHAARPNEYPLVLPDGQEGLWHEFFSCFDGPIEDQPQSAEPAVEVFNIHTDDIKASFYVQCRTERKADQVRLLVHSPLGTGCLDWQGLGEKSWPVLLAGMRRDDVLKQLFGQSGLEFDSQATCEEIAKHLRSGAPVHALDMSGRKDFLEAIDDLFEDNYDCETPDSLIETLDASADLDTDEGGPIRTLVEQLSTARHTESAEKFWNEVWPAFITKVAPPDDVEKPRKIARPRG